ncbi:class I SAM-dependent RNA methyltransferase [Sphingomonas solaris]|uniref:Class I SAM-dependent RNA methyltransferase n=1 Tax=Alterirhizorhabdus solaris TaxID=2529389 RepID=A0A558QTD1_9SPHN|nr:class I SAM-dependent RNA methyltransferase [Sphingomonas solaris]TVV70389.1 class I SAM-dependent RNA methyltransferase [Sphingomonas solaris]
MNDLIDIVRLAGRGDGVTDDGTHYPLTAPGDTVDAFGVVAPGPHHVTPPCRHFPRCGGCQLQHVDDASYGDFIVDRIVGALEAQGLEVPPMDAAHLSPPRTRRRASLRAEKQGKRVVIGFNEGASHRIVDMTECHILHPDLFALVAPLRRLLGGLLRDRRAGGVQMTLTDQGVDLMLEKVTVEGLAADESLTDFAAAHRLARLTLDDGYGPQTRYEPEPATVTLGGVAVPLPPGGFLQATADGEAALLVAVLAGVGDAAAVADLFAGLGTFALPLSANAKVLAVEGARDPALALKAAGARAQRLLLVEHRDLFRRPLDGKELARFDAIVLDPPRAGAREQVDLLSASAVPRIVYVSCNPGTFARDARALIVAGYRIERVTPVGQFRWSTHVELVAAFTR